jgi:SAM-dependent methyltransferase
MSKIITQWGHEVTPFQEFTDSELGTYISSLANFFKKLKLSTGYDFYSTYGTLLGAVRQKSVIANDFDFDFAVVIENYVDKYDLASKFKEIVNKVRQLENVTGVDPASACQCGIRYRVGSVDFKIDLFLAWFEDDLLIQSFSIDKRFGIGRSDIFPLINVELNGVLLPAPRSTEILLSSIYGKDWLVPDPDFRYDNYFNSLAGESPTEASVFGRIAYSKSYWDSYYLNSGNNESPSQFAVFTCDHINGRSKILELGAGSGRDTFHFSRQGHDVTCIDYSDSSLKLISSKAEEFRLSNINFKKIDFADYVSTYDFSRDHIEFFDVVYARFLLHAISESVEQNVAEMASLVLKANGFFFAEFRAKGDLYEKKKEWNEQEVTSDHYRRPIELSKLKDMLARHDLIIDYSVTGKGYAYHASGDPLVSRIIAIKRQSPVIPNLIPNALR